MARRSDRRGTRASSRRKSYLARRSGREWAARGALAVALAMLGYMGLSASLARALVKIDPARAYALVPGNGVIVADYAEDAFGRAPTADTKSLPAELSRRALLADPTATDALTVLGFQAQLRGDAEQRDRIFAYSVALSRRELRPRIWAIEEAVARGDIAGALRNYDIALRTSSDAAGLLFPVLTAALVEPRIRSALLSILATNPVWRDGFIAHAASSGVEPQGAIALFREGRRIGLEPGDDLRGNLVNTLMAKNSYDEAWTYYRSFRPGARRDRSRDPSFALETETRTVFDWRTGADNRISAAILREGNSGLVDFSVPPSVSGELVSQMQLLPAGSYRIHGRSRGIDQPELSRPYWALTCQDGRELGRVVLTDSEENDGRFTGRFTVPPGCAVQKLALVARSTDDIMGVSGQIDSAQLVPDR